jgi:hypothetical protein
MERDLSATVQTSYAIPATGGTPPPNPTVPTLVLDRYPAGSASPPRASGDEINEEVYCLTSIPNSGSSAVAAVGYFCQWLPDIDSSATAPHAFALMRQYLDSNGVFARLQSAYGNQPPPPAAATPLSFLDIFTRAPVVAAGTTQPATNPPVATSAELADYVWDLQIRIDTNVTAASPITSAPLDHANPQRSYGTQFGEQQPQYPVALPPYVEIRFKALGTSAARRLEGNTSVTRQTWEPNPPSAIYQQVILPAMQQFVLRVPLYGGAPTPAPSPSPSP